MMNSNKALLLISASGLLLMPCGISLAAYSPRSSLPDAITSVYTHFTHTSHPKETLLSSAFYPLPENSGRVREGFKPSLALPNSLGREEKRQGEKIKLASVCFVTDTNDCTGNNFFNADDDNTGHGTPGGPGDGDDYDLDNEERCKKEGYTQTSCLPGETPANPCPYDNSIFAECTCPAGYTTCETPYFGVGEACGNKYASCKCNPCTGYDYTSVPDGYVQDGESCLGCDGQKHFKIKPNPCDGFLDCGSMGGDTGANSCLSGTTTLYDNCKPCPNLGTLSSCPVGYSCTFEECSGLSYKSGCSPNYAYFCTQPQTDCRALGYTATSCSGSALKCPYNPTLLFCL